MICHKAGNSLNLAVTAVVGQHLKVTVNSLCTDVIVWCPRFCNVARSAILAGNSCDLAVTNESVAYNLLFHLTVVAAGNKSFFVCFTFAENVFAIVQWQLWNGWYLRCSTDLGRFPSRNYKLRQHYSIQCRGTTVSCHNKQPFWFL